MCSREKPEKEIAPDRGCVDARDISERDIYEAMKDIPGYLDITLDDLKEIYRSAYEHALSRLTLSIEAREIMTRKVIYADPRMSLRDVARLLDRHGISGLPVLEDGKVVGVVSEKNLLALLGSNSLMDLLADLFKGKGCLKKALTANTAGEAMTSPAITVTENTTVTQIVAIFTTKQINRVPVLNDEGAMTGIVTRGDIMKTHLKVS